MRTVTLVAACMATFSTVFAQLDTSGPRAGGPQEQTDEASEAEIAAAVQQYRDSVHKTFKYQTGKITLSHGVTIEVPKGFKYLDAPQSHRVLEELWGNLEGETMGMIFPEQYGPLDDASWAFDISFDGMGYVKDEDADKMDYDDVLKGMKEDDEASNKLRKEQGLQTISTIGWAAAPFYDSNTKTLHWAMELQGSDAEKRTLNYHLRVLGRKGVLVMSAIGTMDQLPEIKKNIPGILKSATFESGHAYADFDPKVDEVAAWTVGSLVAGKVLAKVGFFAILAKFGKLIVMGLIAAGAGLWKWIRGRRRKEEEVATEAAPELAEQPQGEEEQKS